MANEVLERYAHLVAKKPVLVLAVAIFFVIFSLIASSNVKTVSMSYSEMMPKHIPEIDAMNLISDEFGTSGESASVAIEVSPNYANSNEVRDIRDPRVLKYLDILEQKIIRIKNVMGVTSAVDIFKQMNGGEIPQSKTEIVELMRNSDQLSQYITRDYSLTVIKIQIAEMKSTSDREEFVGELKQIVAETESPPGVKTSLTGSLLIMSEIFAQIEPALATTSTVSFVGILVIVFALFMSLRHGITSLLGMVIGVMWAYGIFGLLGMSISSTTSGAISMIMGVGIDFGIQVVTRFRQELRSSDAEEAIATTLANTMTPMSMTVIAALVGFRALSLGKIRMLGQLGDMMSIGILMCFLAATTIIPSILVINEKYFRAKASSSKPVAGA